MKVKTTQRIFTLEEITEEQLNLILGALRLSMPAIGSKKEKEIDSLILTFESILNPISKEKIEKKEDILEKIKRLSPFGNMFCPFEYFEGFENLGPIQFIIGKSNQLGIYFWNSSVDYENMSPADITMWFNKHCVKLLKSFLNGERKFHNPLFSVYESKGVKTLEGYLDNKGNWTKEKDMKFTLQKDNKLRILKDSSIINLSNIEVLCLKEFLNFHFKED